MRQIIDKAHQRIGLASLELSDLAEDLVEPIATTLLDAAGKLDEVLEMLDGLDAARGDARRSLRLPKAPPANPEPLPAPAPEAYPTAAEGPTMSAAARARYERRRSILAHYAESGNIEDAVRAAGVSVRVHYHALHNDPAYASAFRSLRTRSTAVIDLTPPAWSWPPMFRPPLLPPTVGPLTIRQRLPRIRLDFPKRAPATKAHSLMLHSNGQLYTTIRRNGRKRFVYFGSNAERAREAFTAWLDSCNRPAHPAIFSTCSNPNINRTLSPSETHI